MLTTVHARRDTRIFIKQVQTLRERINDEVFLVVADGLGHETTARRLQIYDLGAPGKGRVARAVMGSIRAFRLLRNLRPRGVHFHDPELIPLGLVLKLLGFQVIYDVHEDVPRQIAGKKWIPAYLRIPVALATRIFEALAAKMFDAVVSATPAIGRRFPESKSVLVQNFPLATELISPNPTLYEARPSDFCYVGGVASHRGAREMVLALGSFKASTAVRLHVAGPFMPPALRESLSALKEWERVVYRGILSRAEVAELFGTVRAGIVAFHPAPNHINAQPTKLFEYMAAALPVIASDFPLWREIVDGARCGLLVDPTSAESMAEAMKWILAHPKEAEDMGRRGREAVAKRYNWDREAEKLVQLYRRLAEAS